MPREHGEMRLPERPPRMDELIAEARDADRLGVIVQEAADTDSRGRYVHWDKLRHLSPPGGLTHREWWLAVKLHRLGQFRQLPLLDTSGGIFRYTVPDAVVEQCHRIDMRAGGSVPLPASITSSDMKMRHEVDASIEEAVTSSMLEGAATTRERARAMLRSATKPRDEAERMILNNFETIEHVGGLGHEPLSTELVCRIHRWITEGTLDSPGDEGRIRSSNRHIDIGNDYGQVFHKPPLARELDDRLAAMCSFANETDGQRFIHPLVRATVLHFWLAYDHPFVDGNGRTARAIFYWSMLRNGYWLARYVSISDVIFRGPKKYARAFLLTETDDNDLTHFIAYHLNILEQAVEVLFKHIDRKAAELRTLSRTATALADLNYRQQVLISHALEHLDFEYTIESHRRSHGVVHQTARTDLLELAEKGLMSSRKVGRQWRFTPVADLDERLRK